MLLPSSVAVPKSSQLMHGDTCVAKHTVTEGEIARSSIMRGWGNKFSITTIEDDFAASSRVGGCCKNPHIMPVLDDNYISDISVDHTAGCEIHIKDAQALHTFGTWSPTFVQLPVADLFFISAGGFMYNWVHWDPEDGDPTTWRKRIVVDYQVWSNLTRNDFFRTGGGADDAYPQNSSPSIWFSRFTPMWTPPGTGDNGAIGGFSGYPVTYAPDFHKLWGVSVAGGVGYVIVPAPGGAGAQVKLPPSATADLVVVSDAPYTDAYEGGNVYALGTDASYAGFRTAIAGQLIVAAKVIFIVYKVICP